MNDRGSSLLTQRFLIPEEEATISGVWVQHKTHTHIVTLALHTVEAPSFTSESGTSGFSDTDAVDRLIGACSKGLCHRAVNMVGDPATTSHFRKLVQVVFGEAVFLAQS